MQNQEMEGGSPSLPKIHLKDNSIRADILIKSFKVLLAIILLLIGYFIWRFQLIVHINDHSPETIELSNWVGRVIGISFIVNYIVIIVLFVNWFRRAYGNLHRAGAGRRLTFTERQAAWSFFIPIVNLARPYTIAKEILYETRKKIGDLSSDFSFNRSTQIVGWWWALFLIERVVSRTASSFMRNAHSVDKFEFATQLAIGSNLFTVGLIFVTLQMIKTISREESNLFTQVDIINHFGNKEAETQ